MGCWKGSQELKKLPGLVDQKRGLRGGKTAQRRTDRYVEGDRGVGRKGRSG